VTVPIENLHVGEYVAVTEDRRDVPARWRVQDFPGFPLQVMGISAPFLAVFAAREQPPLRSIDLRAWGVSKLDPAYVAAWLGAKEPPPAKKRRRKKPKADAGLCQRCGLRLVQKLRGEAWHYVCPECGEDRGVVA